jgi:adenylate cyclase
MKPKKERQLAAIMFTDIVGYTALMQKDEAKATKLRARHRAAFRAFHALYGGEIIQYYGDGTLSIFKSAVNAALCAIDIQKRLQLGGDPVPLRIGLHMGDIVFDSTEVYGDAVNFASRIENLGIASSILLSAKLNDELKNHTSISTTSLGHYDLKNIADGVEVFAISNNGITVPQLSEVNGKLKAPKNTIAVLPFVNMSESMKDEYFTDGITEEIINALSKINTIQVTSRTSSSVFKNKSVPLKQIAKELNVSAILEGSFRRSDDTVRITAQLIRADGDYHCWSESWNLKFENSFEIQEVISLHIAEKLRAHGLTSRRSAARPFSSLLAIIVKNMNVLVNLFIQNNQSRDLQGRKHTALGYS